MTSSARPRSSRSLALKGSRSSTASNGHEEQGEVEPAPKSGKRVIRLASRSAARKNSRDGVSSPSFTTKRSKKDNTITDEGKKSEEIVKEEDPKEEMKMYERWAEEYYEIVEQLPLELHRTYALIKELETKVQDRITFVASETQRYRDVRLKERGQAEESAAQISAMASSDIDVVHPDYGTSSDRDAEGEIIEEFYEQAQGMQKADMTDSIRSAAIKTISSSMPPPPRTPRAARLSILADIAKASTDAIRAAEEKLGLAVTAYDWVDRHIRRLDGDLQRSESSLLLGLRAGTEASRGVRDALGIGEGDNSYTHRRQSGLTSWEDEVLPSDQSTPVPTTSTDARKKSKLAKEMHMTSTLNQADVSASLMTDMAIDPNEPKYCYCDQVSSGDMVACDNEDCPREWFHYQCVGLTTPPKGKWYCLFCSPPGYKSSGTFPPDAPCLPPGYANKRSGDTANLGAAGKRGNKKKKKR